MGLIEDYKKLLKEKNNDYKTMHLPNILDSYSKFHCKRTLSSLTLGRWYFQAFFFVPPSEYDLDAIGLIIGVKGAQFLELEAPNTCNGTDSSLLLISET